jgi:hypothetical protein
MNKTLIVILIILAIVLSVGTNIARNTLIDAVNKRMDSSEAILINEIDARLYEDFHQVSPPKNVQIDSEGIQYTADGETVRIRNNGEYIEMIILYSDGNCWVGNVKANVKVEEVKVLNIGGSTKVNLETTGCRIFAITYELYEDFNNSRTTLNRNFTRYLSLS